MREIEYKPKSEVVLMNNDGSVLQTNCNAVMLFLWDGNRPVHIGVFYPMNRPIKNVRRHYMKNDNGRAILCVEIEDKKGVEQNDY